MLTYLATILESLDHPDLVHMMLHYLLAMPETSHVRPSMAPRSPTATKRQNSLMLLSEARAEEERLEPTLFSLVDLMLNGIRSQNPQTAVAALKLSSVMLTRHRNYAVATLVRAKPRSSTDEGRTGGSLAVETENLLQLAAHLGRHIDIDEAYTAACQDMITPLEVQLAQQASEHTSLGNGPSISALVRMQKIASDDPYLTAILDAFRSFFTNSVDVNLALTEALMNLALCSNIGLDGWLAVPPTSYEFDTKFDSHISSDMNSMDEEEASALRKLLLMQCRPHWEVDQLPALLILLQSLNVQLDNIRLTVTNIDGMISKRMEILGGIDKDERHTALSGRLSSDYSMIDGARPDNAVEPRQVKQLRGQPSVQANSRASSVPPSRALQPQNRDVHDHPSRAREDPLNPSTRSSSLPKTSMERTHQNIFQPPPPDPPEEEFAAAYTKPVGVRENEAELLRRRLRFHRTGEPSAAVYQFVPEHTSANAEGDLVDSRGVSLSHVLTNVVILHHFVIELAAVMQTRANVLEDVGFV